MSAPGSGSVIARVLAAFDAQTGGGAAFEAAADIAARLHAEFSAVFVEDTDLLRLAELPFVRQVSFGGGPGRRPTAADLEAELRALARDTERRLQASVDRLGIPWSFRSVRGPLAFEVGKAMAEADLLVVEAVARAPVSQRRLRPEIRSLLRQTTRSVLLLQPGIVPSTPVVALLRGAAEDGRTLEMSIGLAAAYGAPLTVLTTAQDTAAVEAMIARLKEAMGPRADVRLHVLEREVADLAELRAEVHRGILVMAASVCAAQEEARLCALAELPFSVVLAH
jgi:hypothetical protein